VIVISPVSVQSKWREMQERYGLPVAENLSFCGVRSVRHKQPKHGMLTRRDYTELVRHGRQERTIQKTDFDCTDKFAQFLSDGVLLVIDDFQHLKNVTSQFTSCQELIRGIVEAFEAGSNSRVLLLSGSPIDKEEQATTLFRTLNVMRSQHICRFNVGMRQMEVRGMDENIAYCRLIDYTGTSNILNTHRWWYMNEHQMRRACYQLFQRVFKPRMASAMPPPTLGGNLKKFNAFYDIRERRDREKLTAGVRALESAVRFDRATDRTNFQHGADALSALTLALLQIETAKLDTIIRIARNTLMTDVNTKVVICVNYTRTLEAIAEALAWWNPLRMDGGTSKDRRKRIMDSFQEGNTSRRVLIANSSVCATGIDLDDKHGEYPRLALVSPNYNTINLYQLGHRFQRLDTKSDATVHMVFAKHAHELPVINALARKGGVMRETTVEQAAAGVLFQGSIQSGKRNKT
jgi:hypothetical protein